MANKPWFEYVGPCLDIIKRLAYQPTEAEKWCSAKSAGVFLDEHSLWVAARMCAVGPGEPTQKPYDHLRPVHGVHVHGRNFYGKEDKKYWCETVHPIEPTLSGMAVQRYKQITSKANCAESQV